MPQLDQTEAYRTAGDITLLTISKAKSMQAVEMKEDQGPGADEVKVSQ